MSKSKGPFLQVAAVTWNPFLNQFPFTIAFPEKHAIRLLKTSHSIKPQDVFIKEDPKVFQASIINPFNLRLNFPKSFTVKDRCIKEGFQAFLHGHIIMNPDEPFIIPWRSIPEDFHMPLFTFHPSLLIYSPRCPTPIPHDIIKQATTHKHHPERQVTHMPEFPESDWKLFRKKIVVWQKGHKYN